MGEKIRICSFKIFIPVDSVGVLRVDEVTGVSFYKSASRDVSGDIRDPWAS